MKRPLCMVCCMLILLGMVSVWIFPPHVGGMWKAYDGEEMILTGKIVQKEKRVSGNKEVIIIYLKSVKRADICVQNLPIQEENSSKKENSIKGIICYLNQDDKNCRIGTNVVIKGTFQELQGPGNPGEFHEALYYQTLGYYGKLFQSEVIDSDRKYSFLQENLYRLRQYLEQCIDRAYEKEEAELLKAILLGNKSGVDVELKNLYQKSGIIHILAISGLHISVLGMGLYGLLRRLTVPVKASSVLSFLFLVLYGMLVGNGISILRAVGMFGLKSLGRMWGRTYDLLTSLALLAVLLMLEQPLYLYHSGYWLSFGSVAGIAVIYPILQECVQMETSVSGQRFWVCILSDKRCQKVTQALLASMSVTIMTLPITLWFFYETPVYSALLNLLVSPLMTVVMVLGVVNLGFSVACIPSYCIGKILQMIFILFEKLCLWSNTLPGHIFRTGRPHLLQIILFYLGLAGTLLLLKHGKKYKKKSCAAAVVLFIGAVSVLLFRAENGLSVSMLDTGQGDMGVILYENSAYIIDAGSSSQKNAGKDILIPFLKYQGITQIEAVFVTHPDEDHCNGILELLKLAETENFQIKRFILPRVSQVSVAESEAMQELVETAELKNIPVLYFYEGMQLKKDKLTITCLHPDGKDYGDNANAYSQVLLVNYQRFSMAYMGDIEGEAEQAVMKTLGHMEGIRETGVTVLKVAHHGSCYSTGADFLKLMQPRISLISAGRGNRYGHPHKETLERLSACGTRIYQTAKSGAVTVAVRGDSVRIEEYRKYNK